MVTEGFLPCSPNAGVPFGVAVLTAVGVAMADGPLLLTEDERACWSPVALVEAGLAACVAVAFA